MSDLFEKASRLKLRFDTPKGRLTVEDLWDLPLTSVTGVSLDEVAKSLRRALKDAEEESFVVETSKANDALQTAFDVVKHIIDVRKTEIVEARTRTENRAKKQKLLSLIAEKQDESLKASTVEELQAMVEAL